MAIYSGQCVTADNVTFVNPAGSHGVAQSFQYRYDFASITLYGLNTTTSYLVLARPKGTASLVNALVEAGMQKTQFNTCLKGTLSVSAGNGSFQFSTPDAILVRTEGRITIESFVFNDISTYMFFSYT